MAVVSCGFDYSNKLFICQCSEQTINYVTCPFISNVIEYGMVNITIRRKMGRDIDGACRQLRQKNRESGRSNQYRSGRDERA